MYRMAIVSHSLAINGVNLLQPGVKQEKDGCVYPAISLHMSYNLRKMFAEMKVPYGPAGGCLFDSSKWRTQLRKRGFTTTNVWHVICDARDYMGVPLMNGTPVKMRMVGFAKKDHDDRAPSMSVVRQMLGRHETLIGVLEIRANYNASVPYLLDMDADHEAYHAVVLLAYREIKAGDQLCDKVPPGSYFVVQDSNTVCDENPLAINLVASETLVEAYFAIPEFPYQGL